MSKDELVRDYMDELLACIQNEGPQNATATIKRITRSKGDRYDHVHEYACRAAMWHLIDEKKLRLDENRMLHTEGDW